LPGRIQLKAVHAVVEAGCSLSWLHVWYLGHVVLTEVAMKTLYAKLPLVSDEQFADIFIIEE
jgi:hypothetical protein